MKTIKFKTKYLYFFAVFFVFIFLAGIASAAELFLEVNNQTTNQKLSQGDEFQANIFLNTTGEKINAVSANVSFPNKLLELKEIRNGNSIINFWASAPKLSQAGTVNFSGIITGGYGGTGILFSLIFLAKSTGNGAISFNNADVLLNDGKGTQASLKISPLQFSILKGSSAVKTIIQPMKDVEPPDDFTPEVVQNSTMFNGKYFLVFAAQDQESGIDHYQVYESKTKMQNLTNVKWNTAVSPYVLQDQGLHSFIYVKVVDKAGNEKTEVVVPRYPMKWYETWWFWFIIIIIGLVGLVFIFYLSKLFLWKRKK